MKFSEAWLREWVNPDVSTETLVEQLTMGGLEVESAEPVAAEIGGVVVGEVTKVEAHPDADYLKVCVVSDGRKTFQVLCGAPNVRIGLKAPFARVGAKIGNETLEKRTIRGLESDGMLLSGDELGIEEQSPGLLELDDGATVGQDVVETLGLDDVSIDIDLTPNRGDCLGIRGLAREVGVLNALPVKEVEIREIPAEIDAEFPVTIEAFDGCPRYLGRVFRGVDVTRPTPLWMRERLRRSGLRAIDPVVDVTNYVLLELGQPMHAFDLDRLRDGIVVRMAKKGETITLLDGQNVELGPDVLLITDGTGPVAMAGIMGGERSGIHVNAEGGDSVTRDIFLEVAYFAPSAIAGRARRHGIQTDASYRYERGVDFELQHRALQRASELLVEIVGGQPGPVTEAVSVDHLPDERHIRLRASRLNLMMGIEVPVKDVDAMLHRLGLEVSSRDEGDEGVSWKVVSPSYRFDLEREADLVEEVCRVYGYNNLPDTVPSGFLHLKPSVETRVTPSTLRRHLAALGYQEAITYSFIDPPMQDLLDPEMDPQKVVNPLSQDVSVMRTSLWPGLVRALLGNLNRQQARVRLFEIGRTFRREAAGLNQDFWVGGVAMGPRTPESWAAGREETDFFDVKGDLESLIALTGEAPRFSFEAASHPALHPGQCARILRDGSPIGFLGRMHPEIQQKLDIAEPVHLFEVALDGLAEKRVSRYEEPSRFPSVRRDIALLVARDCPAAAIRRSCLEAAGEHLTDLTLFDVYHGEGIDSSKKSVALGLTLQHPSRTLTEEEVSVTMDRVVQALTSEFDAQLR
jgi:phenylalanyl-tRNA synthetase beta chain